MRNKKPVKYYVGDFETTVYKGQTSTLVWASACVELFTDDVKLFGSIDDTYKYLASLDCNVVIYYHNLKFDGEFWLSFLMTVLRYKQACNVILENDNIKSFEFLKKGYMPAKTFIYSISNIGAWYGITINTGNNIIEIRDSLKLLPFSVRKIGNSFGTKHHKLDMKYEGLRYPNCPISDKEAEYIKNDVLVVKEALEIMFEQGHNKLTIGSCCLYEYKKLIGKYEYSQMFPNLYDIEINEERFGSNTAGEYIHKSYHGGWCYVVRGKENIIKRNGLTADVNSLYPSVMSGESGNKYPVGKPHFWHGNYIPDICNNSNTYYFIRIRTKFYLKENMLPFIQIKGSWLYRPTEMLETSDIYNKKDNRYYEEYVDDDGKIKTTHVILTLTCTDYIRLLEHYDLVDCTILDGCYFMSLSGIFDEYINKYKELKLKSKGALRELAKLFLNNLYGKMAASNNSSFKIVSIAEDGSLKYSQYEEYNKEPGYIAVGSAITSYARDFTIRHAQKNYYGRDKRGFIYADTDSIHCDLSPEELIDIKIHDKDFLCWKLEATWDEGLFVRQKTYIEHVIAENLEIIDNPYYNIKCAGMPENCKELFLASMTGQAKKHTETGDEDWSEEELKFVSVKRTINDFKEGLEIPGKLVPKHIPGGVLLTPTTYKLRSIM